MTSLLEYEPPTCRNWPANAYRSQLDKLLAEALTSLTIRPSWFDEEEAREILEALATDGDTSQARRAIRRLFDQDDSTVGQLWDRLSDSINLIGLAWNQMAHAERRLIGRAS
jgi:hypothetical protein